MYFLLLKSNKIYVVTKALVKITLLTAPALATAYLYEINSIGIPIYPITNMPFIDLYCHYRLGYYSPSCIHRAILFSGVSFFNLDPSLIIQVMTNRLNGINVVDSNYFYLRYCLQLVPHHMANSTTSLISFNINAFIESVLSGISISIIGQNHAEHVFADYFIHHLQELPLSYRFDQYSYFFNSFPLVPETSVESLEYVDSDSGSSSDEDELKITFL